MLKIFLVLHGLSSPGGQHIQSLAVAPCHLSPIAYKKPTTLAEADANYGAYCS